MMNDSPTNPVSQRNQVFRKHLVSVILWSSLFTLAYAQSPLYTSNQNQYFLHGLAAAGYGDLAQDWLANTFDPTPVFSGVVYLASRSLFWPPIFYLFFGVLAGIYLFSLLGIVSEGQPLSFPRTKRWFYLAALILVHSAAVRFLVVRLADPDWAHLFDGGVAGQRLLGTVFQPSAFGVLLVFAMALFLGGKIKQSILCLVLAATFHPTYLLSAALLTVVFMGLAFAESRRMRPSLMIGGAALLGVLPILIHTYITFKGSEAVSMARARDLLVNFRIPHHAIPAVWFDGSVIIKIGFVLLAVGLTRKTRLFHLLLWPFLAALGGSLVQGITNSEVLALLFPWRVSTWLVPVSVAVIVARGLEGLWPRLERRVSGSTLLLASLVMAIVLASSGLAKSMWEAHEKKNGNDRPMMAYVASNKTPGSVYLIPLDMQDFRLATGAAAYIEFKSIPYKDVEVLEWYRRVAKAGNLYRAPYKRTGCQILSELYREGVTNVVLPYDHTVMNCENIIPQYTDPYYQVYQLVAGE